MQIVYIVMRFKLVFIFVLLDWLIGLRIVYSFIKEIKSICRYPALDVAGSVFSTIIRLNINKKVIFTNINERRKKNE